MEWNKQTKILIVGLGLMGGSYARALSEQGYEVGALDKRRESIDFARTKGWIRHGGTDVNAAYVGQFDLIVFALYPHVFVEWIRDYQHLLKPGALLTDVTGVKQQIVDAVQGMLREDLEYIGAHPMAGREVSGVEHANCEMFQNANYIVTPTERNTPEAIAACRHLGEILGFRTITELGTQEHDEMIGFLSQLTHCIAVSLMVCKDSVHLSDYTGDSFRDLTRIAKINDEMWSELFLLNKQALLEQMDVFSAQFERLRECVENDNVEQLRAMMRLSTERRSYFDRKGEIKS